MKSHGGKSAKSIGRLSMAASPSLGGVTAFNPDRPQEEGPAVKGQQFTVSPDTDKDPE